MPKRPVTETELFQLLELCADGEARCVRRCLELRQSGNNEAATHEGELADKYRRLKHQIFSAMGDTSQASSIEDVLDELRAIGESPCAGKSAGT
jgi:hypothetical protein